MTTPTWDALVARLAQTYGEPRSLLHLELDPSPADVRRARSAVRDALAPYGDAAPSDEVLLMLSEVVTNGVLHGRSRLAVDASAFSGTEGEGPAAGSEPAAPRAVLLGVADSNADSPRVPEAVREEHGREGGRGLHIVSELAHSWGCEPVGGLGGLDGSAGGKIVWFLVTYPGSDLAPSGPGREAWVV